MHDTAFVAQLLAALHGAFLACAQRSKVFTGFGSNVIE